MKRILPIFCALLAGCALAAADLLSGAKAVGEAGRAEIKTVVGKPALVMTGSTADLKGATNRYLTARIDLPQGVDLKGKSISFKITGSTSGASPVGLYFRAFEKNAGRKPLWSFKRWGMRLSDRPQTFLLTAGRELYSLPHSGHFIIRSFLAPIKSIIDKLVTETKTVVPLKASPDIIL